jgi:hypothetical protein
VTLALSHCTLNHKLWILLKCIVSLPEHTNLDDSLDIFIKGDPHFAP